MLQTARRPALAAAASITILGNTAAPGELCSEDEYRKDDRNRGDDEERDFGLDVACEEIDGATSGAGNDHRCGDDHGEAEGEDCGTGPARPSLWGKTHGTLLFTFTTA